MHAHYDIYREMLELCIILLKLLLYLLFIIIKRKSKVYKQDC